MEEDLTNVSLTLEQARDLLAQLSAALDGRHDAERQKDERLHRSLCPPSQRSIAPYFIERRY